MVGIVGQFWKQFTTLTLEILNEIIINTHLLSLSPEHVIYGLG